MGTNRVSVEFFYFIFLKKKLERSRLVSVERQSKVVFRSSLAKSEIGKGNDDWDITRHSYGVVIW